MRIEHLAFGDVIGKVAGLCTFWCQLIKSGPLSAQWIAARIALRWLSASYSDLIHAVVTIWIFVLQTHQFTRLTALAGKRVQHTSSGVADKIRNRFCGHAEQRMLQSQLQQRRRREDLGGRGIRAFNNHFGVKPCET
ncbi:hypothetical protein ALP08_200023 [Pseudomonas syringae pv. pisi]|nr:hypothetical protein ALP08_200023 [Pseudomonas syringae pv. pisi]